MEGEPFRHKIAGPVFPVPGDGMALFREVHPDLMLAAGEEMNFHQAETLALLQNFVGRTGELTFSGVRGRVDLQGFILGQIGGDYPLFVRQFAMDDGQVVLFGLRPILLQEFFSLFAFGKNQDPGGVLIEAMDHIHPVARLRITFADIIIEQIVGRSRLLPISADGQQPDRLHHHEDILVLMQNGQSTRLMLLARPGAFRHISQFESGLRQKGPLVFYVLVGHTFQASCDSLDEVLYSPGNLHLLLSARLSRLFLGQRC